MTIHAVLREELWAGRTGIDVTAFLRAAGMVVDQNKVSAWKRDRVPTIEQLAEIEQAHGLPRGWILWRAGYTDAEALVARGDAPPQAIEIVTLTPAEIIAQFAAQSAEIAETRRALLAITKQLKRR